jgi:hypothetical protein
MATAMSGLAVVVSSLIGVVSPVRTKPMIPKENQHQRSVSYRAFVSHFVSTAKLRDPLQP